MDFRWLTRRSLRSGSRGVMRSAATIISVMVLLALLAPPIDVLARQLSEYRSPDTAWVASIHFDGESRTEEICLRGTRSGKETCRDSPLGGAGGFQHVAFAPDSHLIATRFDNGIPCVWSVPSLDTWCLEEWESTFIHAAMTVQWAPDSSAFAFEHSTGEETPGDRDLVVVEIETRSAVNLTDDGVETLDPPPDQAVPLDGDAVWSPDSDRLLIVRRRWIPDTAPERWDYSLIVVDRDGGKPTTIHTFDAGKVPGWGGLFWTADDWILYSERWDGGIFSLPSDQALRQVRPDGSGDDPLVDIMPFTDPGIECVSDDGRYLLVEEYNRGDGSLPWLYGVIDRAERTFTELETDANGDPIDSPCTPPQTG